MMTYKQKKNRRFVLLAMTLILLLPVLAFADSVETRDGDNVVVAASETVESGGVYGGNIVTIDGTINGTTIAAGQEVVINGTVNGDLIAAAQVVTVRGKVKGNVITAAQTITLSNEVDGNIYAAAQNVTLSDKAAAARDAFLAGATVQIDGKIGRDLFVGSNSATINSEVGRHATMGVESMVFGPTAKIKGDLTYGTNDSNVTVRDGVVLGTVKTYKVEHQASEKTEESPLDTVLAFLWTLAAALLIWLLLELLRKGIWQDFAKNAIARPVRSLGFGVLAGLILIPLAILLAITVIGVPAALILLTTAAVFSYLGRIFVAVTVVEFIIAKRGLNRPHRGFWLILMVLLLWSALSMLPVVGAIVKILSSCYAFGVVVLFFKKQPPFMPRSAEPALYEKASNNTSTEI